MSALIYAAFFRPQLLIWQNNLQNMVKHFSSLADYSLLVSSLYVWCSLKVVITKWKGQARIFLRCGMKLTMHSFYSLGPNLRLRPLHWMGLTLLVWHCTLKLWLSWLKRQLSNEHQRWEAMGRTKLSVEKYPTHYRTKNSNVVVCGVMVAVKMANFMMHFLRAW